MSYLLHIAILAAVYATLAVSLNLLSGYAGILSVAHAAFYAIGAYTAALVALHSEAGLLSTIVYTAVLTGGFAVIVGIPGLKSRKNDFVITSFALQVLVFGLLSNLTAVTGGPMGLNGIPHPKVIGTTFSGSGAYTAWALLLLTSAILYSRVVRRSPFGRVLLAFRDSPTFTESQGKRTLATTVAVFASGAVFAGLAGNIYAHYVTYIDPGSFTVIESIFILTLVIVGGAGSVWGPVAGAVALVCLPELLRFLGLPQSSGAAVRQLIYGIALVACMLWRPQGLMGEYAFRREERRR